MEARASFGRTGISKGFIAVVAVLITLGLAVAAAAVAKNAGGSSATTQTQAHAVVKAQAPSYAQAVKAQPSSVQQPGYRGGKVTMDDGPAQFSAAAPRAPPPRGCHGPTQ